jgi:xylulokinase
MATMAGLNREAALDRASAMPPGAEGMLLMPYLTGERTPNLPRATGSLSGLTPGNATPKGMVRAALDGVAAGFAYCLDALRRLDVFAPRITLVGGGSRHDAWRQAIADATGLPVVVRGGEEHAARGAALQALAIARDEPIVEVVHRYRPEVIAEARPRPEYRDAFRLDERRQLIAELQATNAN